MPSRRPFLPISALSLALATSNAYALPFDSPDPRSFAMGGAGVAAGTSANAVFLNPALLAAHRDGDNFSLELPILAGRVRAQDEVYDAIDDFDSNDPISRFDDAINNYDPLDQASVDEVVASGEELITFFNSISDKVLQLEGNAAVVVGIPSRELGISVFANTFVLGGAIGTFNDEADIQEVIDFAGDGDPIDPNVVDGFDSEMDAIFAQVTEFGASFARTFDSLGGVSIGVTPKLVKVTTYDYTFVGSELDDVEIDFDQNERSDSDLNLDVGIAKDFPGGFQAGLTVKNLISQEYTTFLGNRVKLEPMARAGVAFRSPGLEWVTLAADIDLTESEPAGLESKTQYLGLGAEFDAFSTAQFRIGYRNNMSDLPSGVDSNIYSAGFGFSPFGVHFDMAVSGNTDDVGAAMQLGFRF